MKTFVKIAIALTFCLTILFISSTSFAQRLVDNGNGTVTDTQTRLMWTKNADPFWSLTWDDAMSKCSSYSISGISGWRMPSSDELVALSDAIKGGHPFTRVQGSYYWSSSESTISTIITDHTRVVVIYNGFVNLKSKSNTYPVWPVRFVR